MSLSICVALITLLMVVPIQTHQLFTQSFFRQRNKIALDNAAIVLGQRDRSNLNFISSANQVAAMMEKIHHPIHLAIQSGVTTAQLIAQDKSIEYAINEIHQSSKKIADFNWQHALVSARVEAGRLGVMVLTQKRPKHTPLIGRKCILCLQEAYWDVDDNYRDTSLRAVKDAWVSELKIEMGSKGLKNNLSWNYRVNY